MQGMAEECLESYFKRNNKLPDKIIFYRDGVSQGAYARFKMEEVTGVRNAYAAIVNDLQQPTLPVNRAHLAAFRKPELADEEFRTDGPLITAIVGEKRHHTRFFPTGVPVTSDENTPFGTFVEAGPTSPYYYDFFLQAHQAVAGTVKPTHYFVVVDENKISMDTLVTIVSIPPPSLSHTLSFYPSIPSNSPTMSDQRSILCLPTSHLTRILRRPNILRRPPRRTRPQIPQILPRRPFLRHL